MSSGDDWDDETADSRTQIQRGGGLWEDVSTDDEGAQRTRAVDAAAVLSLLQQGPAAAPPADNDGVQRTRAFDAASVLGILQQPASAAAPEAPGFHMAAPPTSHGFRQPTPPPVPGFVPQHLTPPPDSSRFRSMHATPPPSSRLAVPSERPLAPSSPPRASEPSPPTSRRAGLRLGPRSSPPLPEPSSSARFDALAAPPAPAHRSPPPYPLDDDDGQATRMHRPPQEVEAILDEASLTEEELAAIAEDDDAGRLPADPQIASRCAAMLGSSIPPRVIVGRGVLVALKLDHRAGFLLSMVDGASTVRELIDVCGMRPAQALEILDNLARRKIIALGA